MRKHASGTATSCRPIALAASIEHTRRSGSKPRGCWSPRHCGRSLIERDDIVRDNEGPNAAIRILRRGDTLRMNLLVLVMALTTTVQLSQTQVRRPTSLPVSFERVLASVVKPTSAERRLLLDGAPVTKLLDADPSKEIAVFGAVWIDAPRERYAAAVKDIERFESGGAFRITRKISVPPTLADFAELRLPEEDVADLGDCEVGDCELKLGKQSIEAIRSRVNFSQPGAKSAVEA